MGTMQHLLATSTTIGRYGNYDESDLGVGPK